MAERTLEQGQSWVRDVFEQAREQYRDTVPVAHIFPWRGGQTVVHSREEPGAPGVVTYYLAFEVGQATHDLAFTARELTECADPDNAEARFAVKKKILDTFTALESH